MNMLHKAMTIAGSDASGGAGMEADLKTFQELDVYGMTALTVIVAQNPHKDWDIEIFPIVWTLWKNRSKRLSPVSVSML